MPTLFRSLLLLLARAGRSELALQVQYLKVENEILRGKLPGRVPLTQAERRRLIRFGVPLGKSLQQLISIVSPRTFARWLKRPAAAAAPARPGRPRTSDDIRSLVLRLANDNAWGYTRICGELKKLRITGVSRSTVANILRQAGLDPGPKRGRGTWHDFIKRHTDTLWACDFLSTKIWTLTGLVDCAVLFFIHVGTRRVHLAGITTHPDRPWLAARAHELRSFFAAPHPSPLAAGREAAVRGQPPRYLIRDSDSKFSPAFDQILQQANVKVVRVGPGAPNLNAFAERFVLTVKQECLDHFVIFGETHLRYLLTEFLEHYHLERPHQGRGNTVLTESPDPQPATPASDDIVCRERLGGLLKHYHRRAG